MDPDVVEVLERLRHGRSTTWLRIVDDARLDEPVTPPDDAAEAVEPYRWLLERIGAGVTLTQAGYLPPAFVLEAMDALGETGKWVVKGNREESAIPVRDLRESATRFGLVRKQHGRLLPSRAGRSLVTDPIGLWWHIASRLPDGRAEPERHAGILAMLMTAAGRAIDDDLLAVGMSVLGWADARTRQPLLPRDASYAAAGTVRLLRRMSPGLGYGRWDLPPTAGEVALARAALLGTSRRAAEPVPVAGPTPTVELTVTLRDIEPPIWRRLSVPTSLTLAQTHEVLQTAMGWKGYHLHLFDVGGTSFGDVEDLDGPLGDEDTHTLADALRDAAEFTYEYDFGDGWTHDVRLDAPDPAGPAVPRLVAGARACPPEDCGGPWGYAHLLEVLGDPDHAEHAHLLDWTGGGFDPEAFDPESVNANLELFDRHSRRTRR